MLEAFGFGFMQHALLAGLLAAAACGMVGSLVVINRIAFISGGLAHAAYGGIGLAVFFGLAPLLGAVGFSLALALLMAWISLKNKRRADTVIGVMWALGMALGVILIDLSPGYKADLMGYLFGSILTVPGRDLWLLAGLDAAVGLVVWRYYRHFLAMSFDDEFAASRGVPVGRLYVLLIVMIALTTVLLIRVVGLILVVALLTIPPYIAERLTRSLAGMMLLAGLLSAVFSVVGLILAFHWDLSAGPTIILLAGAAFFLSLALAGRNGSAGEGGG